MLILCIFQFVFVDLQILNFSFNCLHFSKKTFTFVKSK